MSNNQIKNIVLITVALGAFLIPFMGTSLSIALPPIGIEFSLDAVFLSWISTAFILANAALILPFGRIADIYGRKKIFTYGILIYTFSSFLGAVSLSGNLLLISSFLQGIGCSMIFGTGVALLSSVFNPEERGKSYGIYVGAVYAGIFSGLLIGGFLIQNFGWRTIFIFNVPIGIFILSLLFTKIKSEWKGCKGERFDFIGSILFIIIIVTLLQGFSTIVTETYGKYLLLIGLLTIFIFLKYENSYSDPLITLSIFKNPLFTISVLSLLIINVGTSSMNYLLSLYFQYLKLLPPNTAGLILVLQPIFVALISPIAGRISDKYDPRLFTSTGMLITTIGLFILIFLNQDTPFYSIILGLILIGIGVALFASPATNAAMSTVNKKFYGVASATVSTMVFGGQLLSMAVVILIFAFYLGNVQIIPQYYPLFIKSANIAFIVYTAVCFIAIFALLLMGRNRSISNEKE
ncbi:MFS transporter [Methanobacterium sp. ACI-7]|uniref:MFS transporter n=1 Tax=unclassified Methanobacterium TaxID=2627676 RepID=UPI0039C12324